MEREYGVVQYPAEVLSVVKGNVCASAYTLDGRVRSRIETKPTPGDAWTTSDDSSTIGPIL